VSLDLELDDAQQAIADALGQFCAERCGDAAVKAGGGRLPEGLWGELAELGVLALATPEGEGGAMELVAAMEALGAALFPGPLAATFFAAQVVPAAQRAALARGETLVSLGAAPLLPWAPVAQLFVEVEGERAFAARPRGPVTPVDTLGGEPWGRVDLERGEELGGVPAALALHDLALAAYLAAAGRRLVEATAEHARTRRQFDRPIGDFQAVAHPLADRAMRLDAAVTLARAAAFEWDGAGGDAARPAAAAARLSASRAALEACYTGHQLFGALGITLEGPVFHVSRRVRQLASQPPSEAPAREALLARFGLGAAA
jgi:alkylation response protein AidB-like acyl-CoA dehydrogenase